MTPESLSSDALVLPALSGRAVALRAFRARDIDVVLEAAYDPVIPLITSIPASADREQALAYIARQHDRLRERAGYSFAIADHSDTAVGQIGLWLRDMSTGRASIGYWVAPSARGRGVAAEALGVLVEWARTLPGLDRVELYVEPWNQASWRTAERVGLKREGLLREWQVIDGTPRDMFIYALQLAPRREL